MQEGRSLRTPEEIARAQQEIKDLATRNQARIEKIEAEQKELKALTTAVNSVAIKQDSMYKDVSELKGDVKQIKEKPGKRWDNIVSQIITLVTAAVVGWILLQIGL